LSLDGEGEKQIHPTFSLAIKPTLRENIENSL